MKLFTAACLALCAAAGCGRERGFAHCTPPVAGVTVQQAIDQYQHVWDYCLVDVQNGQLLLNPAAIPYDLQTPLFSDYALKYRAVWVPPGTHAQYSADGVFDFPVGTVLIKTFAFAPDLRAADVGQKAVETRYLIRNANEWVSLTYLWNDAQTDAVLDVAGETRPISFIAPDGMSLDAKYLIPSANQCGQCHDAGTTQMPIGPKARQLNKSYPYAGGAQNQLDRFAAAGILVGAPPSDQAPKLAVWNDPTTGTVDERARAWLEGNCAHCHSDAGLARTTGLTLWASETNPIKFGVCKTPVAAGPATGGRHYDIVPGQPDQSILMFRIEATQPGIMMPQLGRSVVHAEGVQLIRDWITAMPGTCP
jgi:uncharacterized repeat protein (TIGR03806 family)